MRAGESYDEASLRPQQFYRPACTWDQLHGMNSNSSGVAAAEGLGTLARLGRVQRLVFGELVVCVDAAQERRQLAQEFEQQHPDAPEPFNYEDWREEEAAFYRGAAGGLRARLQQPVLAIAQVPDLQWDQELQVTIDGRGSEDDPRHVAAITLCLHANLGALASFAAATAPHAVHLSLTGPVVVGGETVEALGAVGENLGRLFIGFDSHSLLAPSFWDALNAHHLPKLERLTIALDRFGSSTNNNILGMPAAHTFVHAYQPAEPGQKLALFISAEKYEGNVREDLGLQPQDRGANRVVLLLPVP